jgi:methylated-DNA-protein-cysteine methyltransferase-like protein
MKAPRKPSPEAPQANDDDHNFYTAVYRLVRAIPRGRVMTYGQIAVLLGHPRAARAVGYALKACKGHDVPWQRVINAQGSISARSEVLRPTRQRQLLEQEGIVFDARDTCDLNKLRWEPEDPERYLYRKVVEFPLR